jgi:hypothetical protein
MSFTLVLESDNGTRGAGGTTQTVGYNFNWSVLPNDSEYDLTYSFVSRDAGALTADTQYELRLNGLGAITRCYAPTTTSGVGSSTVVGLVRPNSVANTHFLTSNFADNPPVHLLERPSGNNFTAELWNVGGATQPTFNMKWTLILYFHKVEK